jgi:isochorismate hydrolase
MPGTSETLHGSAPDSHPVALLQVDVINPLDFPEADQLLRYALPAAEKLADLKRRARQAGVPVIYANDNFGRWRSDLTAVVERCRKPGCKGGPLAKRLHPGKDDYHVLKPKHSAFFSTTLDTLLRYQGCHPLGRGRELHGFGGRQITVLFSAALSTT